MDDRELVKVLVRLAERVKQLEQRTAGLPVRWGNAAASDLPPGGEIYDVLMVVDENGNKTWSKPRFSTVNSS